MVTVFEVFDPRADKIVSRHATESAARSASDGPNLDYEEITYPACAQCKGTGIARYGAPVCSSCYGTGIKEIPFTSVLTACYCDSSYHPLGH